MSSRCGPEKTVTTASSYQGSIPVLRRTFHQIPSLEPEQFDRTEKMGDPPRPTGAQSSDGGHVNVPTEEGSIGEGSETHPTGTHASYGGPFYVSMEGSNEEEGSEAQPTGTHASHGGHFNVSAEEGSNEEGSEAQPTGAPASHGGLFNVSTEEGPNEGEKMDCTEDTAAGLSEVSRDIPPGFRAWEAVAKKNVTKNTTDSFKFKVVSYNVLAQYLLDCHFYLYADCSPSNLPWEVRAARIYDEIVHLAPDILCLQEVQASHLESFYSKFEALGYCGVFKQRTGGHREDGCAIYYRQSLFELQDHITVEFYQPDLPILNRDNIGVMVKLLPRGNPSTPIVVATTHLSFGPDLTELRLAQIQVFMAEIDRFAYYTNEEKSGLYPIILTGDFNSTPDSAVVKFVERGRLSTGPYLDHTGWQQIGVTDNSQHFAVYRNRRTGKKTDFKDIQIRNTDYSNLPLVFPPKLDEQELRTLFNSGEIRHSLHLVSAYNQIKKDGAKEASTFHEKWVTVDYIFFRCCSNLYLCERLRLPSAEECAVLGRLPNDVYGSDHLAIGAVFELTAPSVTPTLH